MSDLVEKVTQMIVRHSLSSGGYDKDVATAAVNLVLEAAAERADQHAKQCEWTDGVIEAEQIAAAILEMKETSK